MLILIVSISDSMSLTIKLIKNTRSAHHGQDLFGFIFASIAGIMVYISLDELLPAAPEYGESHLAIYGVIIGMAVMAVSLILFI